MCAGGRVQEGGGCGGGDGGGRSLLILEFRDLDCHALSTFEIELLLVFFFFLSLSPRKCCHRIYCTSR